jgi:hypothetical protein
VVINVLQEGFQAFSELNLIQNIPADESDQEPVALLHELNVLGDCRVGLLRAVVDEVDGEIVHVEIPQQSLVLLVLSYREIHEHHELFLLLTQYGELGPGLGCGQLDLEAGRQGIDQLRIVRRLIRTILGQLVEDFSDPRLGLPARLVALVHEHVGLALVDPQLRREDLHLVEDVDGLFVL